jgi:hypothetical protein
MLKFIFNRAVEEYQNNIKVMFSFGVLLVFLVLFVFFEQFFVSSGTVFILFNESILAIVGLLVGIIFLYFFSFFVSLTIYSVRRDVQSMSFDEYWNNLMKKASLKIFVFYLILAVIIFVLSWIGLFFGVQVITSIICFVLAAILMYVPQSIILDEANTRFAILESINFFFKNFVVSAAIIIIGFIVLTVLVTIEFLLELIGLPGMIVSLVIILIVLVPFLEQMKSYAFVLKCDLIKQPEVHQSKVKPKPKVKITAVRLREQSKKGKI